MNKQQKAQRPQIPQYQVKPFILSDEEKCALIDIVRYQDAGAVVESFRNELLLRLAHAAVNSLYGDLSPPTPSDLDEDSATDILDPSNQPLAIQFIPLASLPCRK